MKKLITILIGILFAIALQGQSKNDFKYVINAKGGVSVGQYDVSGTNVAHWDSSTIVGTVKTDYKAGVILTPAINAADQVEGVALADSSDGTLGKKGYATSDDLLTSTDPVDVYTLMGSTIVAIPLGITSVLSSVSASMIDGELKLTATKIRYTKQLTSIGLILTTAGDYTPDNYNGVGLYSLNSTNDSLILRALSDNNTADPNLWEATAGTIITNDIFVTGTTKYTAAPGLYWVGVLYNSSAQTTAPSSAAYTNAISRMNDLDFSGDKKLVYFRSSQATLPLKVKLTDLTSGASAFFSFIK